MPDEGDGGVVVDCDGRELRLSQKRLLVAFADEAVELAEFCEREGLRAGHRSICIDAGMRERARDHVEWPFGLRVDKGNGRKVA